MSIAASITNYILNCGANVAIAARDILGRFRSRGATYSTLSRLSEKRVIIRVAKGVYVLSCGSTELPSAKAIVEAKAEAFGKKIFFTEDALSEDQISNQTSFVTDGCRSNFDSVHGRIYFKSNNSVSLKKRGFKTSTCRAIESIELAKNNSTNEPPGSKTLSALWALLLLFRQGLENLQTVEFYNQKESRVVLCLPQDSTITIRSAYAGNSHLQESPDRLRLTLFETALPANLQPPSRSP